MNEPISMEVRQRAIAAAQVTVPFDLLLTGGTVVDVATLELREADVGIVGEMIASVHPRGKYKDATKVHDLSGRWIAPGLIDGQSDGTTYLDHMGQIAKAAEISGFHGGLIPSFPVTDDPWVISPALAR